METILETSAARKSGVQQALLAEAAGRLLWGHSPASRIGLGAELLAQSARLARDEDWEEDCRWANEAVHELRQFFDRPDAGRTRVLLALSTYLDELAGSAPSGMVDVGHDPEP